jgi:hypothetical protein
MPLLQHQSQSKVQPWGTEKIASFQQCIHLMGATAGTSPHRELGAAFLHTTQLCGATELRET